MIVKRNGLVILYLSSYGILCFLPQVGFNITPNIGTPMQEVLQMGLEKYLDELMGISSQASKEFALEKV